MLRNAVPSIISNTMFNTHIKGYANHTHTLRMHSNYECNKMLPRGKLGSSRWGKTCFNVFNKWPWIHHRQTAHILMRCKNVFAFPLISCGFSHTYGAWWCRVESSLPNLWKCAEVSVTCRSKSWNTYTQTHTQHSRLMLFFSTVHFPDMALQKQVKRAAKYKNMENYRPYLYSNVTFIYPGPLPVMYQMSGWTKVCKTVWECKTGCFQEWNITDCALLLSVCIL